MFDEGERGWCIRFRGVKSTPWRPTRAHRKIIKAKREQDGEALLDCFILTGLTPPTSWKKYNHYGITTLYGNTIHCHTPQDTLGITNLEAGLFGVEETELGQ